MSEKNVAVAVVETDKAKRGRKVGSTNVPNSAIRAYIVRTMAGIADLPAPSIDAIVAGMAPTVRNSDEFKSSPEFLAVRTFKVAESISRWDADMREDYIRAIVATSDPRERELLAELLAK